MTEIVKFLFNCIVYVFELMKSFSFELFGFTVNLFSLALAFIIISVFISFLRMGMNTSFDEVVAEPINRRVRLNRKLDSESKERLKSARHVNQNKRTLNEKISDKDYKPRHG